MVVVGGFLPLGLIIYSTLLMDESVIIIVIHLLHVLLYGSLFYFICKLIMKGLAQVPGGLKMAAYLGIVLLILGCGFLPIYGAGHNSVEWVNVYELYTGL